ncbi:MAG TPA: DUF4159 domain-containing protein [Phycisphaerae bacterium]|nr:DUF4159 domain-containing protein [Phycisphaerae bacterium]
MLMHYRARAIAYLIVIGCCIPSFAEGVSDRDVDAAIRRGVAALLDRISQLDEVTYVSTDDPPQTLKVRGTIVQNAGGTLRLKTPEGWTLSIAQNRVSEIVTRGHITPELEGMLRGGPSALAALALVTAGVETTEPKMAMLLDALAQDDTNEMGTYVHSLRSATWSALLERRISRPNRQRFRKLLTADLRWLVQAMQPDGGYNYTQAGGRWDHSNTQFGNLGVWAAGVAKLEVSPQTYQTISHHWLETQDDSGGWSYRGESTPTSSMTIAGCNSLYIVLDQLYTRSGGAYRLFGGIRPDKKSEEPVQRICAAIARGDDYLRENPPNPTMNDGYELFGLERLGLASGQAILGGEDWYRQYVDAVSRRGWGENVVADSFALIFLVHGQAPVVIQRMVWGQQDRDAGYYFRDVANLTRYLSRTFERLHRWQRISVNAELREMQDAPLLYLSGRRGLELPESTHQRIRHYLDAGGTVFLHSDGASRAFTASATALFEKMFGDRGYRFQELEKGHAVYHAQFGAGQTPWKHIVPLRGLSDGSRVMVFLCPKDIAGAWHQDRGRFEDLFRIMANVRVYSAPPYAQLPRILRESQPPGRAAPPAGALRLARLSHDGHWNAHSGAWQRYSIGLRHRAGIDLFVAPDITPDAPSFAEADLVYLTVKAPGGLPREIADRLTEYLKGGGFLLIDAGDGQPAGIQSVGEWVDQIEIGERGVLPTEHAIFRGSFRNGRPLTDLVATDAGAGLTRGGAPPPMFTRTLDGRVVVLACPFDVIAGLDGHFIWNRSGYLPESTERIVDNILLWRLETKGRPSSHVP